MIFFWIIGKQDRSTSSNGKNRRNRVSVRISSFHSSVPLFPLLVAAVHDAADISRVDVKLVDVASVAIVGQLDGQQATGNVMHGGQRRPQQRRSPCPRARPGQRRRVAGTDIHAATAAGERERAGPLAVLDDGRIAFWVVRMYDAKTRKCKVVVGMGEVL